MEAGPGHLIRSEDVHRKLFGYSRCESLCTDGRLHLRGSHWHHFGGRDHLHGDEKNPFPRSTNELTLTDLFIPKWCGVRVNSMPVVHQALWMNRWKLKNNITITLTSLLHFDQRLRHLGRISDRISWDNLTTQLEWLRAMRLALQVSGRWLEKVVEKMHEWTGRLAHACGSVQLPFCWIHLDTVTSVTCQYFSRIFGDNPKKKDSCL